MPKKEKDELLGRIENQDKLISEMNKKIETLMLMNLPEGTRIKDLPEVYKQRELNLKYSD